MHEKLNRRQRSSWRDLSSLEWSGSDWFGSEWLGLDYFIIVTLIVLLGGVYWWIWKVKQWAKEQKRLAEAKVLAYKTELEKARSRSGVECS